MSLTDLKRTILIFALLLFGNSIGMAQACGYIFAKFHVQDSRGQFLDSAKLQLLRRDTGESVVYAEKELTVSNEDGAFRLKHGLCGSHYSTWLVVKHDKFETFKDTIHLPLNSPSSEHVFTIKLKRKGSADVGSIEQWANLVGDVTDAEGKDLAGVVITLIDRDGGSKRNVSSEYGGFYFVVRQGEYSLDAELTATGEKVKFDALNLKPGLNLRDVAFGAR